MKLRAKSKTLILITLGIFFVFSPIITTNLRSNTGLRDKWGEYGDEINLENEKLRLSKVSAPIYIRNDEPCCNWSVAKNLGICTGNGTDSDPYIIKDLVIDAGFSGNGILNLNSNVSFIIENCTIFNAPYPSWSGIYLVAVENGQLVGNNCSSNGIGIQLWNSDNNNITGNTLNNNGRWGVHILHSNYNNISGNTINNNDEYGIYLENSKYNIVAGNILLGNDECISERDSCGNIISDNGDCEYSGVSCSEGGDSIPGYHLFFLLGILSVATIIISKKLKKA